MLVVAATARELEIVPDGVATLCCGIGPVEAAAATARALASRPPDAILHFGLAGARRIEPGSLVLGTEAIFEDIAGDLAASMPRVERLRPDAGLLGSARRALPGAHLLPIGTTARVGAGACEVEAMEGFAVLRAAELAGVPALELRAISNDPDEPDRARWRFEDALAALRAALPAVLHELGA